VRGCVLRHPLHARGDTYEREEGHVTPATLSILLELRYSTLRDQATGRVSQRRDKANGVRQRGVACSGAHCMLGVTRTKGRRAMSRQPRSRFCCRRGTANCETKRRASQPARRQGRFETGCGRAGTRAQAPTACRAVTRQTRRGNAGSGARMLSPNSPGPTLVEGVGADVVDALGGKLQVPRKPGAGAGADERRPCSHTRRTQSQSAVD
jgi:hypothetical protein